MLTVLFWDVFGTPMVTAKKTLPKEKCNSSTFQNHTTTTCVGLEKLYSSMEWVLQARGWQHTLTLILCNGGASRVILAQKELTETWLSKKKLSSRSMNLNSNAILGNDGVDGQSRCLTIKNTSGLHAHSSMTDSNCCPSR